jgi:outer membrane protein assembly factor BamD
MNKKLLNLALVSLLTGFLTACASSTDPSDAYKGETPQHIYQRGKAALQDQSYTEAVKRFEALDVQYPFGADTENAQLYIIYAYYMKEDYTLASTAADHFIRLHPTNPHVDYVYYMRGLSDFYQNMGVIERLFTIDLATRDLTQMQKSYADFDTLVTRFPGSRYAPAAHQYLIYLRDAMAAHELHIADYYFERRAYIAAANRASGIVAHYEGTPSVPDALVLMAKSYNKLGMTKQLQDTMAVIKYNYPTMNVVLS